MRQTLRHVHGYLPLARKSELEAAFIGAWRNRTEKLRTIRGSSGVPDDAEDAKMFDDAVIERLPTMTMDVVEDLWSLPQRLA